MADPNGGRLNSIVMADAGWTVGMCCCIHGMVTPDLHKKNIVLCMYAYGTDWQKFRTVRTVRVFANLKRKEEGQKEGGKKEEIAIRGEAEYCVRKISHKDPNEASKICLTRFRVLTFDTIINQVSDDDQCQKNSLSLYSTVLLLL
jgi:hypothetical protein